MIVNLSNGFQNIESTYQSLFFEFKLHFFPLNIHSRCPNKFRVNFQRRPICKFHWFRISYINSSFVCCISKHWEHLSIFLLRIYTWFFSSCPNKFRLNFQRRRVSKFHWFRTSYINFSFVRCLAVGLQIRRSNSWSESFEDYRFVDEVKDPGEDEKEQHDINSR